MDYLPTDPQNDMNTAQVSIGFSGEKPFVGPASISVLCSHCGALGYSVDKYCACCGYKLTRFCNHCGEAILHPVANYCTQCGSSFAESAPPEDSVPEKSAN